MMATLSTVINVISTWTLAAIAVNDIPGSRPIYTVDRVVKMEYHVYKRPVTWIQAEMFCTERREGLMKMDTYVKLNRIRRQLRSRGDPVTERVFIGCFVCCKGRTFLGSDWKEFMDPVLVAWIPRDQSQSGTFFRRTIDLP